MASEYGFVCPNCGTALPAGARLCADCGQPVTPAPGSGDSAAEAETGSRRKWLIVAGLVAAVVAALAVSVLLRGGGPAPGGEILLGVPDYYGDYRIHMLSVGEELSYDNRVLKKVEELDLISVVENAAYPYRHHSTRALYQDGRWLVQYHRKRDVVVASLDEDGAKEIYYVENQRNLRTRWHEPTSSLLLFEYSYLPDSEVVCLTSDGVEPADPVARADYCGWTSSGVLVTYDESDDTSGRELDLEVTLNDGTSRSLRVEDYAGDVDVSSDGRYALVVRYSSGQEFVEAYDLKTGESIAKTRGHDYLGVARSPVLLASSTDGRDDHSLILFDPQEQSFVEVDGEAVGFSSDGAIAYLATAWDDDGYDLAMVNLSSHETKDLGFVEKVLAIGIVPGYGAIVFDSSYHLSLASTSGEVEDLGRIDVSESCNSIGGSLVDDDTILLVVEDGQPEGNPCYFAHEKEESLFRVDLDSASMTKVVDDWAALEYYGAAVSDSYVVFAGDEHDPDDVALYAVPLDGSESPVVLDDNARGYLDITIRGDDVYYTADVGLFLPADVEVRRVNISGDDDPEVVYEGARLLATSWNHPVRYVLGGNF